ncbi:MAG: TonB-dependent receptor [Stenotrophomonas chelatiphaga]|uniref:TonB-dependent receptor n=1 Tax=Stenotrophomonas chelatiphaga TaxID=517011 RepID=UPI000F4BBD13|nr:TonB-dependent receptor [Stenotrophomonas chelatiphaga]MCS4232632.1 iron complex outermembrane receptor protein [Stenotrophomonas chelatiphaga]ROQ42597.1 iron complex outermembrane receptor protein [Stenotrophomonas maltophilia]
MTALRTRPRPHTLTLALAAALLPAMAMAADAPADRHLTELSEVKVTASPLQGDAESLARPVEVLAGERLDEAKAGTLGDTVAKLPGVQSSYFGPGVGRPIIRGQEGPRVAVLSNGVGNMDASTVSADHATSIEPFLADQIEVLKGPATLLFGSGAIGGAVNVVDGRIASELPERPLSGRAEVRGNSVNDERSGMFRLDGVNGNWVLHVDGLVRNGDDYRIPGYAVVDALEEHDHAHAGGDADEPRRGTLDNSSIRTRAGGVGATWLGDGGFFGLSAGTYRTNYGIPNGAHVHADGDDHDHDHDHDHGGEEEGGDEHDVRIDMVQNRFDVKGGIYNPTSFLKNVTLRAGYTDYEHTELEAGTPATRFTNQGIEGRLEAVQNEIAGWNGAFGLQFGNSDFGAKGEEAFVPDTTTENLGLFVLQEKQFGPFKLELGARHDQVKLDPTGDYQRRKFDATNLSAAGIWTLNDAVDLRFGVDSSERAPTNEELYAAGAHIATRSIELGDAQLKTERGQRIELGIHTHSERLDFSASVYQTKFKDFIYLADTGVVEDLPVRLWAQQDATFKGAEAEALVHLFEGNAGDWDLRVFGDYVKAELDGSGSRSVDIAVPHGDHNHNYTVDLANGGYLPRISPARVGADLRWAKDGWRASVGAVRYSSQKDTAQNEEPTNGYTLVDAHVAYRWDRSDSNSYEVFVDGSNLTNREVRPHTSLLRDYAPLPGRGVAFGIRAYF